jgi:methylated-DNA-[protein]-cysteine S-methyltransferase
MTLYRDDLDSPVGKLSILVDDAGALHMLAFADGRDMPHLEATAATTKRDPGGVTTKLHAYFDGDHAAIDELPVAPTGTPFQLRVWAALREIPCGETRSYGDIARRIGDPKAVRAVGLANGANPIAVVVPCHRVIGADGSLTGYGGGLPRKRWLLAHESRTLDLWRAK